MLRSIIALAVVPLIWAGVGVVAAVADDAEELARQARFIFRGKVEKIKASTLPSVPAGDDTAVVRVAEILKSSPNLSRLSGKDVTVKLKKAGSAKPGESAVFFTNGWVYGKGIAVIEVGRIDEPEGKAAASRDRVSKAILKLADRALEAQVKHAELIVVGRVVRNRPAEESQRNEPVTEHSPNWWLAEIEVASVEKGALEAKTVEVHYPKSDDIMWGKVPRLIEGKDGVYLLHREEKPGVKVQGLTCLDPLDYQPRSRLNKIRGGSSRRTGERPPGPRQRIVTS